MKNNISIEHVITELLLIKIQIRETKNLDKKLNLRRDFADILYDNYKSISLQIETICDKNNNYFNIMSPIGGGYYIRPEASIHCYKCGFGYIEVVFDSYVGYLNLLSDPCGIDNLKLLANFYYDPKNYENRGNL